MRNVELKATYPDLEKARQRAAALGAVHVARLNQTDTFFHVRHGRLKLREFGDGSMAELIAYHRENRPEPRASDYDLVPIEQPDRLRAALDRTLGIQIAVRKSRELWKWENVRIHLDRVDGLGNFLEFEAVIADGDGASAAEKRLRHLMDHFEIGPGEVMSSAYADLLLARDP